MILFRYQPQCDGNILPKEPRPPQPPFENNYEIVNTKASGAVSWYWSRGSAVLAVLAHAVAVFALF